MHQLSTDKYFVVPDIEKTTHMFSKQQNKLECGELGQI